MSKKIKSHDLEEMVYIFLVSFTRKRTKWQAQAEAYFWKTEIDAMYVDKSTKFSWARR